MHENLIIIKQKPVSKTEKLQAKNKAAIKIQKFVKGWLTRKKHENEFISIIRKRTQSNLEDLITKMPKIYLFGNNCLQSALVIQRSFRNYQFRKKVARLRNAYNLSLKSIKKTQAKRFLKKSLKVFFSKQKIFELKNFENIKIALSEIRKKLAIFSIKRIVKTENISLNEISRAYRASNFAKLGINLLESKPSPKIIQKRHSHYYSRLSMRSYCPILSQRNSRVCAPTQASNSKARLRLSPTSSFHKRNRSDYSLYSKPTRPSTPYK